MNIVYTINGEGMGHATRASVVIEYLKKRGHTVFLFASGSLPLMYLREKFGEVTEVTGLHMVYQENSVKRLQTGLKALSKMKSFKADIAIMRSALQKNPPDIVITDFDFHGGIAARMFKVPLVSIDNIQFITKSKFYIPSEDYIDYELNYLIAKFMVPRADHFFITTFSKPEAMKRVDASRVSFVPPLLRSSVLETKPMVGTEILVYQTSTSYKALTSILEGIDESFILYNVSQPAQSQNIRSKAFSEAEFIRDLASAKAVIVNGGFTVITESLYFKKPILSVPIRNHFEQRLNALLLEKEGLGVGVKYLSKKVIIDFLSRLEELRSRGEFVAFDNAGSLRAIEAKLIALAETSRRR